jgi:hypothetical protein
MVPIMADILKAEELWAISGRRWIGLSSRGSATSSSFEGKNTCNYCDR